MYMEGTQMDKKTTDKELKELSKKYEKVCAKLEQLNEQAFELEKEIHRKSLEVKKND